MGRKLSEEEFMAYSTSGNLFCIIVRIGAPLAVFALFSQLFTILDTMMASHLGTIAVSTVAYINQIRRILNAIGTGLVTGSMILVNRAYGAGEKEKTNELLNTLMRIIAAVSALFLLMIPLSPWILGAINAPQEFIDEGTQYLRIMIAATIINFINLIYINVEKSRGRTGIIMVVNLASMILKLLLTALAVYILDLGTESIGMATLITYSAFALYSITHLTRKGSIFRISLSSIIRSRGHSRELIAISYPVTVEDAAFSLGKTIVSSMAAGYGAQMVGALGISNSISGMATTFENGFSDASSAVVSQNAGAGRMNRAVGAYKANVLITFLVSLIAIVLLILLRDPLITLFATSREGLDEAFREDIRNIFIYDGLSCLVLSINGAGMDFLLGLGKTKITLFLNAARIFLFRIPVLLLLQHLIADGATALGLMMMISNSSITIVTTAICIIMAKRIIKGSGH